METASYTNDVLTLRNSNGRLDFGALAMTILTNGNVGIGITTPASKLEIYSTATFNARTSGINIHRPGSYGQYASIAFNSLAHFLVALIMVLVLVRMVILNGKLTIPPQPL